MSKRRVDTAGTQSLRVFYTNTRTVVQKALRLCEIPMPSFVSSVSTANPQGAWPGARHHDLTIGSYSSNGAFINRSTVDTVL